MAGSEPEIPGPQDCGLGVYADQLGHSGGVVSVPTCWLFGLVHPRWPSDMPGPAVVQRVCPRAHRATGGYVGRGASPSAAAAAPKSSYAVAEFLGRCLLPVPWHLLAGERLRPSPRPLVAPPGVRRFPGHGRACKSPECAQDPSQSAPYSGLRNSGRQTALVRSRVCACWRRCVMPLTGMRLGYEHPRRHNLRRTGLPWLADAHVPCMSYGRPPGTDHYPRRSVTCTTSISRSPMPGTP